MMRRQAQNAFGKTPAPGLQSALCARRHRTPPGLERTTLDTTPAHGDGSDAPAYWIIANGSIQTFGIDDEAFAAWVAAEGEELAHHLPAPNDDCPGSTLADLIYRALSARAITSDPRIELNIHGHAEGAGYSLRLNNVTGRQTSVALTRGRHELRWPPKDLTPINKAHHYLHQICRSANTLLADLASPDVKEP